MKRNIGDFLEKLQCQFLCGFPVNSLNWTELGNLDLKTQQKCLDVTITHKLNQDLPLNTQYQIQFLRVFMKNLMKNGKEIHDDIKDHLYRLQDDLMEKTIPSFYKHFVLPNYNIVVSLMDSELFVSNGMMSVGYHWQSAIALTNYLLQHPYLVEQKNVLELGAGNSICGFVIFRCCDAKRLLVAEKNSSAAEIMIASVSANFSDCHKMADGVYKIDEQVLAILHLTYNEIIQHPTAFNTFYTEVLLVPIVVYEKSNFTQILETIAFIFDSAKHPIIMFMAVTVKNWWNLSKLLGFMTLQRYKITKLENIDPENSCLYWDRSTPVTLYQIRKRPKRTLPEVDENQECEPKDII